MGGTAKFVFTIFFDNFLTKNHKRKEGKLVGNSRVNGGHSKVCFFNNFLQFFTKNYNRKRVTPG